jgi:hypothetical protein
MENLRHLMSAYFHQDWWDEYAGSWTAAVDDYMRRSPGRAQGLLDEISLLLASERDDATVARILDELGNYRSPGDSPTAHLDWLEQIRERVAAAS